MKSWVGRSFSYVCLLLILGQYHQSSPLCPTYVTERNETGNMLILILKITLTKFYCATLICESLE